jgi:hypothetical protein
MDRKRTSSVPFFGLVVDLREAYSKADRDLVQSNFGCNHFRAAKQRSELSPRRGFASLGSHKHLISEPQSGDRDLCAKIVWRDANEVSLVIYSVYKRDWAQTEESWLDDLTRRFAAHSY